MFDGLTYIISSPHSLLLFLLLQVVLRTSGSSYLARSVQDSIAKLLCVCCSSSKLMGLMKKCCLSLRIELSERN